MTNHADIEQLATICREAWQEIWPEWRRIAGYPPDQPIYCVSQDCCGVTAFALHDVLQHFMAGLGWRVVGGQFRAADGWRDHVWVERRVGHNHLIVDITADQFGADPVIVAVNDARFRETDDALPPWRENDGFHIALWSSLIICCVEQP